MDAIPKASVLLRIDVVRNLPRARKIVMLRHKDRLTFPQIGKRFSFSKARARQIYRDYVGRLIHPEFVEHELGAMEPDDFAMMDPARLVKKMADVSDAPRTMFPLRAKELR